MYRYLSYILMPLSIILCHVCCMAQNFCIADTAGASTIFVDADDYAGVIRAARDLGDDVRKVTGTSAPVLLSRKYNTGGIVVGTIGKSRLIDRMVTRHKLDVSEVKGQWESYVIDVVDGNLVIAGSDKRGTIYGIYDLSRRMGVSPWYWWADVPVAHRDSVIYDAGRYVQPSPKVKYRGIFINDEWPSFGGWATKRFGGINSGMYAHMFELLLRLKANYLWPAMWASSFNEDDPLSPSLADEYGIVMGTSHHEPMMRAHKEYTKRRDEVGAWNYNTNKSGLDKFFRAGMERNKNFDNIVTIGMRGDGDVAMSDGGDEANMRTLTEVVNGQRKILSDIYGSPDKVPQLWAVFTEVQRYYDAGFNVPDDVTLLLCDNNWGYIRRTAPEKERSRKGGVGLYYHIDMNGGPWNDRWVNTSPLPKLREQLNLAYRSGIDRIWIINVGDLKPKEVPIDFIMTYAWEPDSIRPGDEKAYLEHFAAEAFGPDVAADVADIMAKYPKYNLWRKPEVQRPDILSVENYDEANRVTMMWRQLAEKAEAVRLRIPVEARDAYYQLVYYPAVASATVAEIYTAAAQNWYYADRGDLRANDFADRAKELFLKDSLLTVHYNKVMAGGKWDNMMSDKHIGYSRWSMPDNNILPELRYVMESEARQSLPVVETPSSEYSVAAIDYSRSKEVEGISWIVLPDLGRGDGCMGGSDVTASVPSTGGAVLEYDLDVENADSLRIAIAILPTQDINPGRGLRLGVRLDDGPLQILDARRGFHDVFEEYTPDNLKRAKNLNPLPAPSTLTLSGYRRPMRNEVFDNRRWLDVNFGITDVGTHTLHVVMIDPEVVVERLVVNPDDSKYSYFGPPERTAE